MPLPPDARHEIRLARGILADALARLDSLLGNLENPPIRYGTRDSLLRQLARHPEGMNRAALLSRVKVDALSRAGVWRIVLDLQDEGLVRITRQETKGRPREVVHLAAGVRVTDRSPHPRIDVPTIDPPSVDVPEA